VGCWCGYLSVARCRFAYGAADATVTHCLLLQLIQTGFTFLVPAHPGSSGQKAVKRMLLLLLEWLIVTAYVNCRRRETFVGCTWLRVIDPMSCLCASGSTAAPSAQRTIDNTATFLSSSSFPTPDNRQIHCMFVTVSMIMWFHFSFDLSICQHAIWLPVQWDLVTW